MIVLDTNVISELMRPRPAASVARWVNDQAPTRLYTTSIARAEILYGILLLPKGKRQDALRAAADEMFEQDFGGRILGFGGDAASSYAFIASIRRRVGHRISAFDAQIAAITRTHGASLATRNVDDFAGCDLHVIDPWV